MNFLNVCLALVAFPKQSHTDHIQILVDTGRRVKNRSEIPLRAFRAQRFCCISSITDSIPQNFDSAPLIICTHNQKPQRGSAQDDTRGISRPQIRTRKCNRGRVRVTLPTPAARQCYMVPSPVARAPTTLFSLN